MTDTSAAHLRARPLESQPVGVWNLFLYAAPQASAYFVYMMVLVMYMNFATDVLGIAPAVIGTIFFLSKMWDAVSDPWVGYLSDRTRSRFGRRRSWMLASSLPFAALTLMLWGPPADLGPNALLGWVALSIFGFYTAFTMYYVPHMAFGAEMSPDPKARAWIFGARQIGLTLGMLLAFSFAAPLLVKQDTAREAAWNLAMIGASATALLFIVCTLALPSERADYQGRGGTRILDSFRDVSKNPHARLLLFVYFIEIFGIGGTSAMTIYVLKYITLAADQIGPVFLAYTIPGILTIPIWVRLGQRFERHRVWLFAMGIQAIGYGSMAFQDEGRLTLLYITCLLTGSGTACGQTLGQSIKADVIDYDEYTTGERKEGAYFAVWSFAGKAGTGLMIALSGWALSASGYVENAVQTPLTRWTILFLMGGAPFLSISIGMIAFSRFRLTAAEHRRIREAIDERAHAARTEGRPEPIG